ncbi:TetR/AcrR family transcriptional regulator [Streptomyces achromogenes]|uniref:TetR/AcrR family transcriptional regulator n=1 Tax=Streptomyces achromogenes TaxID=67255 RepID=UPI0036F87FA7
MKAEQSSQPRRADARRNRARVLEAATAAFASDGLLVPLDEIARRAGVGAGTVYRHFPTKEALFEAVILHRVRSLVTEAEDLAAAEEPGEAFFGFIDHMTRESAAKRDLIDALAGSGVDVTANLREINRELRDAIAHLLTRAQRAGVVRSDIGITHFMALLRAAFLATYQSDGAEELAGGIMAVVCDGLRTRNASPRAPHRGGDVPG